MLMALALLAAIDAVPSSTVSLTLTGRDDRPPVSATPRTLSDVARELREGRKAVGGFSAVESTVPQSRIVFVPTFGPELEEVEREPEVVTEVHEVYVPEYFPTWFGGDRKIAHHRHNQNRHMHRPIAVPVAPTRRSPTSGRASAPSPLHPSHAAPWVLRGR